MDKNRKENTETRTKEEKERAFVFLYVCDCVCVCDIFWEKKIAKKKEYWERDIYRERLKTLGKSLRWLSKKQTQKGVNGVLALYWG